MKDLVVLLVVVLLLGWMLWYSRDIVLTHWHFVGHRVPGACCGDKCPHHQYCSESHAAAADVEGKDENE